MSEFISKQAYKDLMDELNQYQLPRGFMKDYVHKKFPSTKNNPSEYRKKYFLVTNVKTGKSWEKGMELGIIHDFKEVLKQLT